MKRVLVVLVVLAAVAVLVSPVRATELWDPHLTGIGEGLPSGANPPPGVYLINSFRISPSWRAWGPMFGEESGHSNPNMKVMTFIDAPVLLWVTPWQFLGASYAMAISKPFDYTNLRIQIADGVYKSGAQWGFFNTILVPYELSWRLPYDFHVKTGLSVSLDDATTSPGPNQRVLAPSGNGYYTFAPSVAVSWLHNGWNVSAAMNYCTSLKNEDTDYQSGDEIAVDYTLTKTIGKWTLGVGAGQQAQINSDKVSGVTIPNSKAEVWTIGPIVGYDFGPCSLQFTYNFAAYTNNDFGGDWAMLRLFIPLWH